MSDPSERQCIVCPVLYPGGEPCLYERQWVCQICRERLQRDLRELHGQEELFDLTPDRGAEQRVSGTPGAALPVKESVVNLIGPGNPHVTEPVYYGDQIGELPVDVWLGEWSAWWGGLWRLEHACDQDLGIADFADELQRMLAVTRAANKDTEQRAEYKNGVPCPRCDAKALTQSSTEDYVECAMCRTLYTPAEYEQWTRLLVPWAKRVRDASRAA